MNASAQCIVPDWPAPPPVKALITTRHGGVSCGPFASLNLGSRTGDDPDAVRENRARLERLLPQAPKWLDQQHGNTVVEADALDAPVAADASIARRVGTVCAILIADCVPVLLTDRAATCVAAAHAGWRGVASGVLEKTVECMGVGPQDLLAYLGPGIGPDAFEVGPEVREAFLRRDPGAQEAFRPLREGKWLADLFQLARRALVRTGVTAVYGGGRCTVSDPTRFYSYRRDRTTGRMAALIWRAR
ncbi:MAG TPA: peptidoglycan editing factor PgeF [Burkholderiales bacterium]|nr:peptidoglycan editing factor PgeF [Burkholderiales bacterium]